MKKYVIFNMVLSVALFLASCSNDVDFGEQYKKTVYIVNSNDMLYVGEHFFGAENDEIVISVYCASSEPITESVRVRLKIDRYAMDSLNAKSRLIDEEYIDKVMLPETAYRLEGEPNLSIQAGRQYGALRVPFNFSGLDPDVAYTLPFTLVSNSAGYEINSELKSIVYEVKMINRFSGEYSGSSQESATRVVGVQPVLKALSVNTVRLPAHNSETDFMILTVASDGVSVSIAPVGNAKVTDLGGSKYYPELQQFELYYTYVNANVETLSVTEIITNVNAPKTNEDE
ncbi:MAG: DUF1735 domain-containing protein [Bacteroidales bacterium]|jgi:hypothetical protein|nr:DUF1735 domain-containing protein [Bacteroidales bacterium]